MCCLLAPSPPPNLHPTLAPLPSPPTPTPTCFQPSDLRATAHSRYRQRSVQPSPLPHSTSTVGLDLAAWGFFVLFSPLSRFCLAKELGDAGGSPWKQNSLSASLSVTAPSSSSSGHPHWIYRCESPCWREGGWKKTFSFFPISAICTHAAQPESCTALLLLHLRWFHGGKGSQQCPLLPSGPKLLFRVCIAMLASFGISIESTSSSLFLAFSYQKHSSLLLPSFLETEHD